MKPKARAVAQEPLTRKRGRITGSRARPRYPASPRSTTREDSTKKGNREGTITLPHSSSPVLAAATHAWGKAISPAVDTASARPKNRSRVR